MRVVSIVGARPQFVKLAPVSRAMADKSVTGAVQIEDLIVHTGQHYDPGMSDVFFDELNIPKPAVHLAIGSGPHGAQTAKMLAAIEETLVEHKPEFVVIYGDTNSTLAGALAAAKLHIPIAHIEAGLRSFNRAMPEEINRIVADHVSDLLLAPTETAMVNLRDENLGGKSQLTGDVMLDAVEYNSRIAENRSSILSDLGLENQEFAIATLHRPSNTDPEALVPLLECFNRIADEQIPIVFPVHPRTVAILSDSGSQWSASARLKMIDPVGYLDMLKLLKHAALAMTDSGGLQKEALFLRTRCITLREETEWPETIEAGGNVLVGSRPEKILTAVSQALTATGAADSGPGADSRPFGDGRAAESIVRALLEYS